MLKKIIIVVISSLLFVTVEAKPDPMFLINNKSYSFKGYYVGFNIGDAFGYSNIQTMALPSATYFMGEGGARAAFNQGNLGMLNFNNFTGGINGGYNWQFNSQWILGVELNFNSLHINNSATRYTLSQPCTLPSCDQYTNIQNIKANWLLMLLPRFGFTHDKFFFYVTGGLALTQLETSSQLSIVPTDSTFTIPNIQTKASNVQAGWVAGAGSEFLITKKWSVKAEYLYISFPKISGSNTLFAYDSPFPPLKNPIAHSADLNFSTIRVGINYHF